MQDWRLLTIEHGRRIIEAEYSEGRFTGFTSRAKQDDQVAALGLREWFGDLLRSFAGLVDGRDMNGSAHIQIIKVSDVPEGATVTNNDRERLPIDDARESVAVRSKVSCAGDFHFDLDLLGLMVRNGRKVSLYFHG